jgi:hypothetical protein
MELKLLQTYRRFYQRTINGFQVNDFGVKYLAGPLKWVPKAILLLVAKNLLERDILGIHPIIRRDEYHL